MVVKVSLSDVHKTIKEYENLGYLYIGSNQRMGTVALTFRDPVTGIQLMVDMLSLTSMARDICIITVL